MSSKNRSFRIGIDARFYGPRGKGLGRYIQRLLDALVNIDIKPHKLAGGISNFQYPPTKSRVLDEVGTISNIQFIIFLRKKNWNEFNPQSPNFKKVLADYKWYGFLEQILFPIKIWRQKIDLMHFPHFNAPVFCPCKFVVTIHDLILRRFPTKRGGLHSFVYPFKELFYKFVIWQAIKRAKKIIAVSGFTKNDILKTFRTNGEKIITIHEGAPQEELGIRNHELGIDAPYILYVGNAYPHKNLERLIQAFIRFKNYDLRFKNYKLILVGENDYFYRKLKKTYHLSLITYHSDIIFTDFVSDRELDALYKNASLYVFPSLCEGFGLPPLEAMAYGIPVISSNQTALPEILRDAALYFNPYSIEDMAEKTRMGLADETLREKLIEKGFERIQRYSWEKMGRETMEIYREILRKTE